MLNATNVKVHQKEEGEEKSIIDYVVTAKRDLNTIKTMKIGLQKEFGMYKVEKQGTKQWRKIYSDHNAAVLNIDCISKMKTKDKEIILQKKVIVNTRKS